MDEACLRRVEVADCDRNTCDDVTQVRTGSQAGTAE